MGAALAWGASDFLGGATTKTLSVLPVLAVSQACGLIVSSIVFAASGARLPTGVGVFEAGFAGVFGVLALALLYLALSIGRSAMVGPMTATGVTLPIVVGLFQGNPLSRVTVVGMLLAGAGIVCSSWEHVARQATGVQRPLVVVGLALGAALATGAYLTLVQAASSTSALGTVEILKLAATGSAAFALSAAWVAFRRSESGGAARDAVALFKDDPRALAVWLAVAAVGITDVAAEILYATSTVHGELSVVAMVSGLYPAVTIGLFAMIYRERVNPVQLLGVVGAVVGLSLIAVGVR